MGYTTKVNLPEEVGRHVRKFLKDNHLSKVDSSLVFDENSVFLSDELDSIIVPLDVAWDAFLEDCYNGNYSSLGQFVYDAQKGIYNKDGVKFEEGSPFGYSDYGE